MFMPASYPPSFPYCVHTPIVPVTDYCTWVPAYMVVLATSPAQVQHKHSTHVPRYIPEARAVLALRTC